MHVYTHMHVYAYVCAWSKYCRFSLKEIYVETLILEINGIWYMDHG